MKKRGLTVGVSDHNGWAVLVTVAADGTFVDRRRVRLIDDGLPCMPYHHDAQKLPPAEALALVDRVRESAEHHAALALDALAGSVDGKIHAIAMRECPTLPATVAERLADYRAQNVADTVAYRNALAGAAEARGWAVHWFRVREVFDQAAAALGIGDIEASFREIRAELGPPWNQDHRIAMAGAVAAGAAA